MQLASKTGIAEQAATETIDRLTVVADGFTDFAANLPIRKETLV
jgi:hypothetical protein